MKYCHNCGTELIDNAAFCTNCGRPVQAVSPTAKALSATTGSSDLKSAAKVFMLLGCIFMGLCLLPLCWAIPMTVHYWTCVENNQPVSTGFKVCTLIFVSMIAGIIMLCDKDN